jgi:hypothetical protein
MTGNELRAAYYYRSALRETQWAALNMYAALRAQPTQRGLRLVRSVASLLREVTHRSKTAPTPLIPILQVDADGVEVRRSLGS